MKSLWNDKNFRNCVYFVLTALAVFTGGLVIYDIKAVLKLIAAILAGITDVFAPLIVSLIVVLFLNRIVRFYDRHFKAEYKNGFRKRVKATAASYMTLAVALTAFIFVLFFKFDIDSIDTLADSINASVEDFADIFVMLKVKLAQWGILENVDGYIESIVLYITEAIKQGVRDVAQGITKTGSWIVNIAIGFTAAFYFLSDSDRIIYYAKRASDVFLPDRISGIVKMFFADISDTFAGYISGQFMDAVIMAVLVGISFWIIGIPYAPVIGVISGFSNLIPYFGAITAFVLSVVLGIMSGTPLRALYAAVIVIILQQIDTLIIVPKVVGKSVKLHPVLVITGLAVFGDLFGITGMVFAVPVTALIKHYIIMLYEYCENKKLAKEY
ncbi:MAG: AI-2E family transporter [Lachnospiraceae bacterium]|nr:AI-2E family transporter [Lachnospiraceae bacterium]